MTAENRLALVVPAGFAHGFETLADGTEIFYQMTHPQTPGAERGIVWNDPDLAIAWPLPPAIMSERDRTLPRLRAAASDCEHVAMEWIPVAGPWVTERKFATPRTPPPTPGTQPQRLSERFEKGFADYIGVKYTTCLPSCTSALHLALAALGIGPGDEVIVPDATWIATSAPISYVGATPVFADIDPDSWCLDAQAFERAITPRTKAVIVVISTATWPTWMRSSRSPSDTISL